MLPKLTLFFFTILLIGKTISIPFLYNAPQAFSRLVASASSASSTPINNVLNLRKANLQDLSDDDPFFKDSTEAPEPGFFQNKIQKVVKKIRFLSELANSGSGTKNPEDDDFDKDFNSDFENENVVQFAGYSYEKPSEKQQVAKEESSNGGLFSFSPSDFGVYLMELFGSLVGLVYGATAQLNNPNPVTTTTAAPFF